MGTTKNQEDKAYHLLEYPEEYPGLLSRREFDRKLLLFRYPSFKPSASWSLYETDKAFWIRRIEWDSSKRFPSEDAEPYTYGCEVSCFSEFAENVLLSLSLLEFRPLKQPKFIGLDGTLHGIKTGNYWLSCSLRWWSLPPDDWRALSQWYENSIEAFEEILPQSTCRNQSRSV